MQKKYYWIIGIIVVLTIFIIIFINYIQPPQFCNKEANCCIKNEDCWSTNAGCFTYEWFAKTDAEARKQGRDNQQPISTPDINCMCDNNACVVHN